MARLQNVVGLSRSIVAQHGFEDVHRFFVASCFVGRDEENEVSPKKAEDCHLN